MPKNTELTFLNATTSDGGQKPDRRLVWSFAAKHSHRVAPRVRRKKALAFRPSTVQGSSPDGYHEWALSNKSRSRPPPARSHSSSSGSSGGYTSSRRRGSPDISDEDMEVLLSTYAITPPGSPLSSGRRCPFDSYPVPFQNWYGELLDHWYYFVLPKSTARIKMNLAEMAEYRKWSLKVDMTEAALFYTTLFVASGIPVSEGRLPLTNALWLRVQAVKAINEALSDPERATSTPIILAVGRIALHEHVFGDRSLAHKVHRPAQQRMLAMRGGIENLNLPAKTLQMMVWSDCFMADEEGAPRIFAGDVKSGQVKTYSTIEALSVANYLSPDRTQHPGYNS